MTERPEVPFRFQISIFHGDFRVANRASYDTVVIIIVLLASLSDFCSCASAVIPEM
jgi:hypothetical protein